MSAYGTIEARWAAFSVSGPSWRRLLLAHVRFTRPSTRLWLDVLVPAAYCTTITAGDPDVRAVALFCVTMACGHAAGNMLNDIEDRETDRRSVEPLRANRPVAVGLISPRTAKVEAYVYAGVGILAAFFVIWWWGLVVLALMSLVLFHEVGEGRVQTRPVVSQAYATLGMVLLWGAVATIAGDVELDRTAAFILLMAIYLGPAESLVKDIRDADNDEAGGKITTPVRFGVGLAARYALWSYVAALPAWALLVIACGDLPVWAIAGGSAVLVAWVAFAARAAQRLERGFDKRTGVRLHQGSMWTFSLLSAALLGGSLA